MRFSDFVIFALVGGIAALDVDHLQGSNIAEAALDAMNGEAPGAISDPHWLTHRVNCALKWVRGLFGLRGGDGADPEPDSNNGPDLQQDLDKAGGNLDPEPDIGDSTHPKTGDDGPDLQQDLDKAGGNLDPEPDIGDSTHPKTGDDEHRSAASGSITDSGTSGNGDNATPGVTAITVGEAVELADDQWPATEFRQLECFTRTPVPEKSSGRHLCLVDPSKTKRFRRKDDKEWQDDGNSCPAFLLGREDPLALYRSYCPAGWDVDDEKWRPCLVDGLVEDVNCIEITTTDNGVWTVVTAEPGPGKGYLVAKYHDKKGDVPDIVFAIPMKGDADPNAARTVLESQEVRAKLGRVETRAHQHVRRKIPTALKDREEAQRQAQVRQAARDSVANWVASNGVTWDPPVKVEEAEEKKPGEAQALSLSDIGCGVEGHDQYCVNQLDANKIKDQVKDLYSERGRPMVCQATKVRDGQATAVGLFPGQCLVKYVSSSSEWNQWEGSNQCIYKPCIIIGRYDPDDKYQAGHRQATVSTRAVSTRTLAPPGGSQTFMEFRHGGDLYVVGDASKLGEDQAGQMANLALALALSDASGE